MATIRQSFPLRSLGVKRTEIDRRGVGGGLVSQDLFMEKYGLKNPDGTTNTARKDHISAVVVSVLQAGAFFGALASAPVSGGHIRFNQTVRTPEPYPCHWHMNSSSWKEENPVRILCYLLNRRRECSTIVSFVPSRRTQTYESLVHLGIANRSGWKQRPGLYILRSCHRRVRYRRNFGSCSDLCLGMCTKGGPRKDQWYFSDHGCYWRHAFILD